MTIITRFAPSPTGFLHIGGARTALFNWLYARHHGGKFLLRIEDTDRERSTQEAVDKILHSLSWLGLESDEPPVFQSGYAARHREVALKLLDEGKAYRCYCTTEELEEMREKARAEKRSPRYDRRCRDKTELEDKPFVVRLKMPIEGKTEIRDQVQGVVKVDNEQLDDMVLLRADGTPTYMLSVVVDDHDMGITHVIRGDDHLTNAFRQVQLYKALDWQAPSFAHIPLIHGPDGAKLSKRHGALGVDAYEEMGFLPEALCNYLLRLGWGRGDEEIISRSQAIQWFDTAGIGKSAARFDIVKLTNFNGQYIREADNQRLVDLILPRLEKCYKVDQRAKERLLKGMSGLKARAKTLVELAEQAEFYVKQDIDFDEKASNVLDDDAKAVIGPFVRLLEAENNWSEERLEELARIYADNAGLKLGKLAQPLRVALTGRTISPSVFDIFTVLGKEESIKRLKKPIQ